MKIEKLLFQEDDQFIYWDGDEIVIFDMLAYQPLDNEVQFVVTKSGEISYQTFNIFVDDKGKYFEYGPMLDRIYL